MIRNFKGLGLALAALFAMSAMPTAAIGAHVPAAFEIEIIPAVVTVTEEEKPKFVVTGQEITCEIFAAEGEATETAPETLTIFPTYSGCKTALGTSATVTGFESDTCWYNVGAEGELELKCSDPKDEVTIDAGPCVIHMPQQQMPVGTVTYTTETIAASKKHDLTAKAVAKKVKAVHTDGFLCPFGSSGASEEMEMQGAFTARAFNAQGKDIHLTHRPTKN